MKVFVFVLLVAASAESVYGQAAASKPQPLKPATGPASNQIETEKVGTPQAAPPTTTNASTGTGYMEPAQVKALLHKIWLTQYRINDLLGEVHPDHWKMPEEARGSFGQTLETLRKALAAEDDWRGQFDTRPDSLYLGFQTYVAISAVLPRLNGVALSVSQYENPSFGAQYSQAGNQLFDLQQSLEPYLAFLLKNQDGLMYAAQTNLAACQSTLSSALKGQQERAIPMKNIAPVFKGTRHKRHPEPATSGSAKKEDAKKVDAGRSPTTH